MTASGHLITGDNCSVNKEIPMHILCFIINTFKLLIPESLDPLIMWSVLSSPARLSSAMSCRFCVGLEIEEIYLPDLDAALLLISNPFTSSLSIKA